MPTVVLIRPGCTDFDDQNRIQGSLDLPLNRRGEDQVQGIVRALQDIPIKKVYTAPCDPARSTAATIGERLNVPVKETDGLRNFDQGLWQGLPLDEVQRKYPKVFKQWQDSPETICPPQGETVSDATERLKKMLQKPLKRKATIALVASEPMATLVSCVLKGEKPDFSGRGPVNGSNQFVEIIETNGLWPSGKVEESKTTTEVTGTEVSP